jgi:hypothetical protein
MKKIIFTVLGAGLISSSFAQDMPEKKVQAGIVFGTGMNFQKMGTKKLESAGVGGIFTVGANANIRLGENIRLCTGLEFDFSSWRYNTVDPTFYRYDDTKILQFDESKDANFYNTDNSLSKTDAAVKSAIIATGDGVDTTETIYRLDQRKHKMIYGTIPLMFTFRTNSFGDFRYFGKFGLRTGFGLSSKIDDSGDMVSNNNGTVTYRSEENLGMKAKNEVFFLKSAVGLAAGAEWKFTSSTALVAEIGFYYGITPLHVTLNADKPDNNHLYNNGDKDGDLINETNSYFSAKATQNQLMIKVGILF